MYFILSFSSSGNSPVSGLEASIAGQKKMLASVSAGGALKNALASSEKNSPFERREGLATTPQTKEEKVEKPPN